MASYKLLIQVNGHEAASAVKEIEDEAKAFVEHLLGAGHTDLVASLRIDGGPPIDLVPPEEPEPVAQAHLPRAEPVRTPTGKPFRKA